MNKEDIIGWVKGTKPIDNDFISEAEKYGATLKSKGLSTSQLRKFFGKIKKAQADGFKIEKKVDLVLMRAQLAYDSKRQKKEFFHKDIDPGLATIAGADKQTEYEKYFKNFVYVIEAIVAYHKFHGGE